ncbi:MAG: signal peptide peptidase SppA [Alphaproteobacteria bacterium]|nr:signal peptide peptidase SppA [Alphaproteobacteria bacterium]
MVAAAGLGAALYVATGPAGGGSDHVARVNIEGFIRDDRALRRRLDEIAADERARALLVVIDSSGGSAAAAEALYTAVRKVGAAKPVAAVLGSTAASGAYLVAIGADRIFARNATLTGSIGVILQAPQVVGLLETLGVGVDVVRSGPLKTVPNPAERLTPAGRAAVQALVDEIFEMFVDMVADRRPLSRAEVLAVADGRVFTGRTAVGNGLADAIGGEAAARDWLAEEHGIERSLAAIDRDPEHDTGLLDRLVGRLLGKSTAAESLLLDGLMAVWHPPL